MGLSDGMQRNEVTVSVVVLAYNEAGNLPKAIDDIHRTLVNRVSNYEIIVVDDGSRDETGRIADELAAANPQVVALHNGRNMGCGYTFWHGARKARLRYVWLIPGDGEIPLVSLETIADTIGTADMILPYMVNSNIRPLFRRVISWGYTNLLNLLFLKHVRYYNGPSVFPTAELHTIPEARSTGFAFTAPIILTLMKRKVSWKEAGILLKQRDFGQPNIKNVLNIFSNLRIILSNYFQIQFSRQPRHKSF